MFTVVQTGPSQVRIQCECGWYCTCPDGDAQIEDMARRHVVKMHAPHIDQLTFVDEAQRKFFEDPFATRYCSIDNW